MSKLTVYSLDDFVTSETVKAFVLNINGKKQLFYGNIEKCNNSTDINYNKNCLFDNSKIYQNIYNASNLYYKSNNYKQYTFNHKINNNISDLIQVKNFIYALNNTAENKGINKLSNYLYNVLSVNNGKAQIEDTLISTYTFNNSKILSNDANYYINCNTTLSCNQIFETNGNISVDYDSGYFLANVFKCKNIYNNEFDEEYNVDNSTVSRTYTKLDKCNDQIYLKYTTNYLNHQLENVETIVALNRHEALDIKKSNIYNIDIVCEKLFDEILALDNNEDQQKYGNKIVQVLKYEIANCVKDICKAITAIDSQLFNVNVYNREIDIKI